MEGFFRVFVVVSFGFFGLLRTLSMHEAGPDSLPRGLAGIMRNLMQTTPSWRQVARDAA